MKRLVLLSMVCAGAHGAVIEKSITGGSGYAEWFEGNPFTGPFEFAGNGLSVSFAFGFGAVPGAFPSLFWYPTDDISNDTTTYNFSGLSSDAPEASVVLDGVTYHGWLSLGSYSWESPTATFPFSAVVSQPFDFNASFRVNLCDMRIVSVNCPIDYEHNRPFRYPYLFELTATGIITGQYQIGHTGALTAFYNPILNFAVTSGTFRMIEDDDAPGNIPEPSTSVLIASGLVGTLGMRKRLIHQRSAQRNSEGK
jgi:hypothetical protein